VRFEVEEDAGGEAVAGGQLEYDLNTSGSWLSVNASSSVVRSAASSHVADGAATANLLTAGAGAFVAGSFDEVDGDCADVNLTSQHTEFEYCVQIRSADVAGGNTVRLRVAGVQVYTAVPSITVTELTHYELDCQPGSFAFTGVEADLVYVPVVALPTIVMARFRS
jgi:hypothetical protein